MNLREKLEKFLFGKMTKIPEDDYTYINPLTLEKEERNPKYGETFGDKELWKPFIVYVVFKHNVGAIQEYKCVITPIIRFSFPFFYRGYNIKLFHKNGTFYFELHNAPLKLNSWLNYNKISLQGDGTDTMYAHGSEKGIYLNMNDAIDEAKKINHHFIWWSEQTKGDIERFEKKHKKDA